MDNQELAEAIQVAYEHARRSLGSIQEDAVNHLKKLREIQADRARESTHPLINMEPGVIFQDPYPCHGGAFQKGGTGDASN